MFDLTHGILFFFGSTTIIILILVVFLSLTNRTKKEEEKLKHHLDQSLTDDKIGDTKDYVEGLKKCWKKFKRK